MLAQTRERLLDQLERVPDLTDAYAGFDPRYAQRVIDWLSGVEKTLAVVRSPLTSLVATQRSGILLVEDGGPSPEMSGRSTSRSKSKRVAASLAMARTEAALRDAITRIDEQFDVAREKLAQLLAVASSARPIPLPASERDDAWLDEVWRSLSVGKETQSMFSYLGARLARSDRRYLLGQVLENLFSNSPASNDQRVGR